MELPTNSTKTDCFAYDEHKCKALNKRYCDFEKCNWYRKKEEVEAGFSEAQMKAYSIKKNS